MARETFFELPSTPDEFGVILPPPNLRKIDFSGLDYPTARRAILEYVRTYYSDQFNDYVASNGFMMLVDIFAALTAKLSLRTDMVANDAFLPNVISEVALANHLALIGQRIRRQTPASVDMEITVEKQATTDIRISAGLSFSIVGPDNNSLTYEIYKFPGDWYSDIVIPAGSRGIIAYGLEGQFTTSSPVTATGEANQQLIIEDPNILESPLLITVTTGNVTENWTVITEPIERYGPNDKVAEATFINDQIIIEFGDDINGHIPPAGSSIICNYRIGGGTRGRIGVGQIDTIRQITPDPPLAVAASVRFRNITASVGGTDTETIEQAKRRAPRDYALQRSIVTSEDYAQACSSYSHPVYGTVSKAVASLRSDLNANLVELYILAEDNDGKPVLPSIGLKTGLKTYIANWNVLTDTIDVLDGAMKLVDVDMVVVLHRNVDASVVRGQVEAAINDFFDLSRWDMGQPLYVSNFVEAIETVDGVAFINLTKPNSNILPTGKIADSTASGVGFNEVITAGNKRVLFYYERSPPPSGIRSS